MIKEVSSKLTYKDKEYKLVFNLNVMEKIQETYGSVELWGDYTDGTENGRKIYDATNGEGSFDELEPEEQAKLKGEPDAKSIIFGFAEMVNEGIDIENEERGETRAFLSIKQVGRLITKYGLDKATEKLSETVIESQKVEGYDSKNE